MSLNKFLAKSVPFLVLLFILALLSMPIHEYFHFHMARLLGVKAHVLFDADFLGGRMRFEVMPTQAQDVLIRFAGGLGTALVFGILWALSAWQGRWTKWNLDDSMLFGIITIVQFVYGIAEGLYVVFGDPWWGQLLGTVVGIAVVGWLYWRQFMRWWLDDEGGTDPVVRD